MRGCCKYFVALLCCAATLVFAIEPYEFPDEATRDRFQDLTYELRCPKCQNQNIADSNAPIAKDLRREVHRMLMQGQNNQEIINFMVERYGDYITYRPPISKQTLLLWLSPLVVLLMGIIIALRLGFARSSKKVDQDGLSAEEKARLEKLLNEPSEVERST